MIGGQVTTAVSGTERVSKQLFIDRMGEDAYDVWTRLCFFRDADGVAHPTLLGIGSRTCWVTMTEKQVRAAMRKLIRHGVVVVQGPGLGRHIRQVRDKGGRRVWARICRRLVYGAALPSRKGSKEALLMPDHVVAWLEAPSGWGGARAGAGHPFKDPTRGRPHKAPAPLSSCHQATSLGPVLALGWEGEKTMQRADTKKESGAAASHSSCRDKSLSVCGGSTDGEVNLSKGGAGAPAFGPSLPGVVGDIGGARRLPPIYCPPGTLPPFPHIESAKTPHPPKLDPTLSSEELVRACARAFTKTVERKYKKRCWLFVRGAPRTWKSFQLLHNAAQVLIENDIAPAAWVAWSIDIWNDYGAKKKAGPPPVTWVFSLTRIQERAGWFKGEDAPHLGGKVWHGPKQLELIKRYFEMERLIARREEHPKVVAARVFPPGVYDRMLAEAKAEAKDYQERLTRLCREGEYLW